MSVLSRGAPYVKKPLIILCYRTLNHHLSSPKLGLIIGQLEYWFKLKPKGFYKFLEPCKHPLYKVGDSWAEELGLSRRQFNKIFDEIGIRYKSKTAFKNEPDPFKGQAYACYHDRKTNKTFFVRNAIAVSTLLNKTPSDKNPKDNQINLEKSTHFSHSRNSKNCRSYGGTIGGKYNNQLTKNTSSSEKPVSPSKSFTFPSQMQEIAEEMKNIWLEEVGECELNKLTSSLIIRLYQSYSTIHSGSLENWRTYCRKIASSRFLMGEGSNRFKAWLSWAVKLESFERIQAGEFTLGDRKIKEKVLTIKREEEEKLREELINSAKHPLWIQVGVKLIERVGGYAFQKWFKEVDVLALKSKEVCLRASSRFDRDYIEKNYRTPLIEALKNALGTKEFYLSYSV